MSEFSQDELWMQRAIELARQGQYATKPNPNVGCVIVKDGQLVGTGFHPKAGEPHAEVFALREAQQHSIGATAYVTLEPCAHYGRTPPCAKALVEAKVAKVVVACLDPNPLVAGKGLQILTDAGIEVVTGVLNAQATELNLGFLKAMATGLPYVRLKIAASLDGRTAMASGESKWITGVQARLDVQHWRAISGAVITGIDTVLADDCLLNVREISNKQLDLQQIVQPYRVILDRQGRLPLSAQILQQPKTVMVMGKFRQDLADLGVIQIETQPLDQLLAYLKQHYQIHDVLVEAGSTLATAFLQQNLVDELIQYIAPTLLGQSARSMFYAEFSLMLEQLRFPIKDVQHIGDDVRLRLIRPQEKV